MVNSHDGTMIFVKTQVDGYHLWDGAPARRGYLGNKHRHRFGIELRMNVDHDDREVEFHDVIDWIHEYLRNAYPVDRTAYGLEFSGSSCERIAAEMARAAYFQFGRPVTVRVDEDGYVGAEVTCHTP